VLVRYRSFSGIQDAPALATVASAIFVADPSLLEIRTVVLTTELATVVQQVIDQPLLEHMRPEPVHDLQLCNDRDSKILYGQRVKVMAKAKSSSDDQKEPKLASNHGRQKQKSGGEAKKQRKAESSGESGSSKQSKG
jgi:hypothetical protein